MGDECDPCACIFNHQMAMRRLLSLLRQSQSYCTDTECLQNGMPNVVDANGAGGDDNSFIFMAMIWMVLAVVLFILRPSSMRGTPSNEGKPSSNNDRQGPPDPPAVS